MTTDEVGLVAALVQAPDDDALWGVYADYVQGECDNELAAVLIRSMVAGGVPLLPIRKPNTEEQKQYERILKARVLGSAAKEDRLAITVALATGACAWGGSGCIESLGQPWGISTLLHIMYGLPRAITDLLVDRQVKSIAAALLAARAGTISAEELRERIGLHHLAP